jgi:hypothetical protein
MRQGVQFVLIWLFLTRSQQHLFDTSSPFSTVFLIFLTLIRFTEKQQPLFVLTK